MTRSPAPALARRPAAHLVVAVAVGLLVALAVGVLAVTALGRPAWSAADPHSVPAAPQVVAVTPAPSPVVTWIPPSLPPPAMEEECGWADVGCKAQRAISGWIAALVKGAINPVFGQISASLLSSPRPAETPRIKELVAHTTTVANTALIAMVVAGGVIVMAHGSVQTSTTIKDLIPRVIVAAVAVNGSLTLTDHAVALANGLSSALLGSGVDPKRAGDYVAAKITASVGELPLTAVYIIVVAAVAILMAQLLVIICWIRVTILIVLIIAAPLALLCHALPQTEGLAKLWWRGFAGVLAIQVAQALVLILAFKIHWSAPQDTGLTPGQRQAGGIWDLVIIIALLYVLIRIPGWTARTIWRQATPQTLTRLARYFLVYKTLGVASAAFKGAKPPLLATPPVGMLPRGGIRPHGQTADGLRHSGSVRPAQRVGTQPGKANTAGAGGGRPTQLELPLGLPPVTRGRRSRHLVLPASPAADARRQATTRQAGQRTAAGWVKPRPPYVQDRLPGMPTRPRRPRQLTLRLDPPPPRRTRKGERG